MREQVIERIEKEKLIAIVRGVSADQCSKVANALYAGGVRLMEITYNQKDPASWQQTAEAIGALTEEFGDKMLFGAGTVTSVELVELTHAHGGKYIISPDTNVDVIKRTVRARHGVPPRRNDPDRGPDRASERARTSSSSSRRADLGVGLSQGHPRARSAMSRCMAVGGVSEKNAGELTQGRLQPGIGVGRQPRQ